MTREIPGFTQREDGTYEDAEGNVYKVRPFKAIHTNIMCDLTGRKVREGGIAYLTKQHATVYQARGVIEINMDGFYGDDEDETPAQTGSKEAPAHASGAEGAGASGNAEGAEAGSDAGRDSVQVQKRRTARRS